MTPSLCPSEIRYCGSGHDVAYANEPHRAQEFLLDVRRVDQNEDAFGANSRRLS